MGDFNIRIKVDPSGAPSTIASVKAPLAELETMGPRVGASISKGFKEGAGAAEQLRDRVQQALNPFASLTQALQREQDMLERIQRPLRELGEGHQVLDSLMRKGLVTAEQYTEQLERLEVAAGKTPKEPANPAEKFEGGVGFVGGLIGGGVAAETIEIGKHFGELLEASHRLHDEYINLTNSVQMFTTSGRSTEGVLAEMVSLSEDLHAKTEPTIALYQRVAENSDRLALSHENQIRLTKSLGEAVELSNHPLEDASGLMAKFSIMMETGQVDSRGLMQIFREAPAAVKVWESAFHESGEKVLADAKAGKLSVEQLVGALIEHGDVLDRQYAKREKTHEQEKDELMTRAKIIAQQYDMNSGLAMTVAGMDEEARAMFLGGNAGAAFDGVLAQVNKTLEAHEEKTKAAARAAGHDFADSLEHMTSTLMQAGTALDDYARRLGLVKDAWDEGLGAQGKVIKASMEHASKIGEARQALATLTAEYRAGTINALEYKSGVEQLTTTIEGGVSTWRKLDKEINEPLRNLTEEMHTLQAMFAAGAIDFDGFYARMQKVTKAMNDSRAAVPLVPISLTTSIPEAGAGVPSSALSAIANTKQADALAEMASGSKALQKFTDELLQLDDAEARHVITAKQHTDLVAKLRDRYDDIRSPADEYAKRLELINEKTQAGIYTDKERTRALGELSKQFDQSAGQGIRNAMDEISKKVHDAAGDMKKAMTDAFDGINDAIVDLVTKGSADFGKLADTIERDFVTMALHKAEAGLFDSLSSAGIGAALGGAATGGDFDIPHAASGFAGVVRAPSGPDSHLAMFHVNPGEHVSIRTPEQMRSQGGGAPVNIPPTQVHVVMPDSRKQLPPPRSREMGEVVLVHIGERRSEIRALLGIK